MSETSPIGLMSRVDKIAVGSCGVVVPNTECKIGKKKIREINFFLNTKEEWNSKQKFM